MKYRYLILILFLFTIIPWNALYAAERIEVEELISAVKTALLQAEKAGKDSPLFRVKEAELEIAYTLERKGGAEFKIFVVTVDAHISSERVHRIKIKLEPMKDLTAKKESSEIESLRKLEELKSAKLLLEAFKSTESAASPLFTHLIPFTSSYDLEKSVVLIPPYDDEIIIHGELITAENQPIDSLILKYKERKLFSKPIRIELKIGNAKTNFVLPKSKDGYEIEFSPFVKDKEIKK